VIFAIAPTRKRGHLVGARLHTDGLGDDGCCAVYAQPLFIIIVANGM
jgi:hypothetical protein